MYYDLIILLIIVLGIIFFCRKFKNFVYLIAVVDIFLRIITFIKNNIGLIDVKNILDKYLPDNLPSLVYRYTNGIVSDIIMWIYLFIFICFLCYTVKILWRRKW